MAPTKTTKKNAPSKSKATQAKGKENAASKAALQTTKKSTSSKSKATKAKGKENTASTAALQATKKNRLRKDSGLGSHTALANTNSPRPEASGAGGDSTTAATSAAEEIKRLKAEVLLLRKEKANAIGHALPQRAEITAIPKPRGEAGSKGFKLIREMGLDDTAEHKQLYLSIMRSVRNSIIKRSIDLSLDFRKVDPDDLSAIFKWIRKTHPYMSKAQFPQNWATAELVKQYMRNHRRYEVKKGRMMPHRQCSTATSSGSTSQLPNIDSDADESTVNKDENVGDESGMEEDEDD